MPDVVEDIDIYPLAVEIAGEFERALAARNLPSARVAVLPEGLPVIEDFGEDCDGYGWVRLVSAYPYQDFPEQDNEGATCRSLLAYQLEIGYAHCSAVPDDDGTPPTPEEQLEVARVQMSAMVAMRNAIRVTLERLDRPYVLGQYTAGDELGGKVGAVWSFTVGDLVG